MWITSIEAEIYASQGKPSRSGAPVPGVLSFLITTEIEVAQSFDFESIRTKTLCQPLQSHLIHYYTVSV